MTDKPLTSDQLDALTEIVNIGIGRAADSLSKLAGSRVILQIPRVAVYKLQELIDYSAMDEGDKLTSVQQDFSGTFSGKGLLLFERESALSLAGLLMGVEYPEGGEIDDEVEGVMSEVGNILLNGVLGSIAKMFEGNVNYRVPVFRQSTLHSIYDQLDSSSESIEDCRIMKAEASFEVTGHEIKGNILILCQLTSLQCLLDQLIGTDE